MNRLPIKQGRMGYFTWLMLKTTFPEGVERFFFFSYYMKSCLFKDVYSKMFPVLPVPLFDLWGNYCRYVHAGVCKRQIKRWKCILGDTIRWAWGLGWIKPFLHLSGRSGLPCPTARLAYQTFYVCTLPSCTLNLVLLLRQPSAVLSLELF